MNFTLLWIDALLVSLLWVATVAAFIGRVKRRWVRGALSPLGVGIPLLLLGLSAVGATEMKFFTKIEPNWFGYALSLLVAYIAGAWLILRKARQREPGLAPASTAWRRAPLVFGLLMTATVGYMVLLNMDFSIRARCAIQSAEINSLYLATLPAITSEAQNAAPLYEKACAHLREDRAEEDKIENPPTGNRDNFDPDEPATIAFLSREAATITLLRRAAALPACRFDQDLSEPDLDAMMSSLKEERNTVEVLNLHAREEIAHGHPSSAIADAAAIFGMSRHIAERPLLVSALVGIGIDAFADKTLEMALPAVKSQDELSALHMEELPPLGRMLQQGFRGEEIRGLAMYDGMPDEFIKAHGDQNVGEMSWTAGSPGAFFRVFLFDPDDYMTFMKDSQAAATQPYYKIRYQLPDITRGRGLFTSIIAPSLSPRLETLAKVQAKDACAQVAVAITRFRLDHGTLPPHLNDLVPAYLDAVPIDPFDGKPLRLAIKGGQWIIYSVGPDGIDDGGIDMDLSNHGKGDIIFTLKPARMEATTKP